MIRPPGIFVIAEMRDQTDIDNSAVFEWVNIAQVLKSAGYRKKQNKTKAMPDKSKFPNVCLLHQAVDFVDMDSCLL